MRLERKLEERENLRSIDELTIHVLKKYKKPMTTYEIAKALGISWSTANIHCHKLKAEGKLINKEEKARLGIGKRVLWWISQEDEE